MRTGEATRSLCDPRVPRRCAGAYLEHGMHNLPQPVRMYYFCPVFRYERPQAGRFRQHHQFGVEVLGDPNPAVDAEVIELAWRLMHSLGLTDIRLFINSIGDRESRPQYIAQLKDYYSQHYDSICGDCRNRLEHNPLRLLDCKVESCRAIGEEAPRSVDHLDPDSLDHWDKLREYLSAMDIPYEVDHRLVRGLDYYTRTVFEIQPVEVRRPVHHLRGRALRRPHRTTGRTPYPRHRVRVGPGAAYPEYQAERH